MLVWCSHCEVQLQQMDGGSLSAESDPWDVLKTLKDELDLLESNRTEIRELGRSLVSQGVDEMADNLAEYLRIEDGVLLKLAQMQVKLAQKELDRQNTVQPLGHASLTDSGIFSYDHKTRSSKQSSTPPPPSLRPADSETDLGARRRTYADVTKTPVKGSPSSSVRSTPPPPVSVKSDSQRHLELAIDEWRQRLVRLDRLIKATAGSEPSADVANNIVR